MSDKPAGKHAAKVGANGVTLFSRSQAAAVLGVHVNTLRKWEADGTFVPRKESSGNGMVVSIYTAKQIEERRKLQNGKVASAAFALFEQGRTAVQVVIELEAPPESIAKLHDAWVKLTGSWVVAGPSGSRSSWERTYQIGKLTPVKLRTALELVAANPALREKLLGVQ